MPSNSAVRGDGILSFVSVTNENKCVHDRVRLLDLESIKYHFQKFQSRMDLDTIPLYIVCVPLSDRFTLCVV